MNYKYLFLVLIISSCSESINIQYEVNDNVSSEQIFINCEYTKKKDGLKKTFCDNDSEGEYSYWTYAKVFDNSSPEIIFQKIKEIPDKRCKYDGRNKCPIGTSPARTSPSYWDGDIYVKGGVVQQDFSWVYNILRKKYSKTEIKNQLSEVEKKFNIKLYPPSSRHEGLVIGRTDDIYDFYLSEYSKHTHPQAEKKLCGGYGGVMRRIIANDISISTRVLPELASTRISLKYYNNWSDSDMEWKSYSYDKSLQSKNCGTWSPYLRFAPKFLNPSDDMSLSEITDGKAIKVIIDINPQNHNLDNLAKEIIKSSSGYCVYKQSGQNKFHIATKDDISYCKTTCYENVYDYRGTSVLKTIPTKFQYSVSNHEINRGEYDKNDLPKDASGKKFSFGMVSSSFHCPDI